MNLCPRDGAPENTQPVQPYMLSMSDTSESLSFWKKSISWTAPVMSVLSFSTIFGTPITECLIARSANICESMISAVTFGDSIAALYACLATIGQYTQVVRMKILMLAFLLTVARLSLAFCDRPALDAESSTIASEIGEISNPAGTP